MDDKVVDVRAYLERLGLEEAGEPSLEALRRIHRRHLQSIPFENLDIHEGVPILLEENAILAKIVRRRRGGFCYELNGAFAWLLGSLGYRVTLLSAEVALPEGGFGIPFDHLTLRVDLGRPYLADVGFGDSFLEPIPLVPDDEQPEAESVYRLRLAEGHHVLERRAATESRFRPQYRFTLEPRKLSDFAEGCHYHQTSPDSTFTQKVLCTRATSEGRLTLSQDAIIETRNGVKSRTLIASRADWRKALEKGFGIELPESPTC